MRYKRNREDAEEVLNQGFLKVLKNLDKYKEEIPFDAWIRKIMINTIIDEYRKHKKEHQLIEFIDFQQDIYHNKHYDFNDADKLFDADDLEQILKRVPPVSQKVFNLFAIDGFSHKEIAKMLGISEGTSKWHVSNSRKLIREMIDEKMKRENKTAVNEK